MAGWKFWQRGDDAPAAEAAPVTPPAPSDPESGGGVVRFEDLPQASMIQAPYVESWDDGEKFFGGFGATQLLTLDYWTLRARSAQLFEVNHYARGIIRTLTTNLVNTGLHLEATPEEDVLGLDEGSLDDWTDDVETRFALWGKEPRLCDHREQFSFGALQQIAFREALLEGDVLVVLRQRPETGIPRVQLVPGSAVQTPIEAKPRGKNRIEHGVELDERGRHVAFWVRDEEGRFERLPAYGANTGRRMAWLVYATDKRHDQVRGKPFLSLVLQSLREIDRYRDSAQRKATNNATLTMIVEKGEHAIGSRPITGGVGGARRVDASQAPGAGPDSPRVFNAARMLPGTVIDELQVGETVKPFPTTGTDERFSDFERAIIQSIAWTCDIPPEILLKSFNNNYSASQAAINEFKNTLDAGRMSWGEQFCQPIYSDWLLSSVLARKVEAAGLFDAWRSGDLDTVAAWTNSDWTGHVKPSVDVVKMGNGQEKLLSLGLTTFDRASRETTGTKFSTNVKKQLRERRQLAELQAVLGNLSEGGGPTQTSEAPETPGNVRASAHLYPIRGANE